MADPPRIRRGHEVKARRPAPERIVTPAHAPPAVMHGDDTPSPVDLPGSTMIGGRPLLWTTTVIALATLFLAITNATAIHGWAVELPPTALNARVAAASEAWEGATDRLALGAPRAVVHGWWKRAQAARFGAERPD